MPLYQYRCSVCGKISEELEPHDSNIEKDCPVCFEQGKKKTAQRIIGVSNFSLKGDGWFKDGYSKETQNG